MTATTARALFIDGAAQAEVRTAEVPDPGPDQLRVRVHHVGICGSDLHYFDHGANGDFAVREPLDRKSTRLNSSHTQKSRMPSSA